MLIQALEQVNAKLSVRKNIFLGLSGLNPSKVLSQSAQVPFIQLPLQHLFGANISDCENQYRILIFYDWWEEGVFNGQIPEEVPFWKIFLNTKMRLDHSPTKICPYMLLHACQCQ